MTDNSQNSLQGQWDRVFDRLSEELGDTLALRLLKKIVPEKIENNQINFSVPSPIIHEFVKKNYADQILALWRDQDPVIDGLAFKLRHQTPKTKKEKKEELSTPPSLKPAPVSSMNFSNADSAFPSFLDAGHTFDSFVVGKSNQFAFAAAKKLAEDDAIVFNPLYLHGSVGLGKTHLMHAIAWRMKELSPEKQVLYLSSEQFLNRFLDSMKEHDMRSFRDRFRSVDVLMIDDIQFIIGKEKTQEEFFHTFNTLIARGKKVIISSDSLPSDLVGIEERLKTRFAQGLVVSIHATSYELRLSILQEKAKQSGLSIPPIVLDFLAKNITSNVRELEGAFKRLVAHAELMNVPITIETTKAVLRDILHTFEKQINIADIQRTTARYFDVSLSDLKSTRRERRIVRPRQIAMFLSKTLTNLSLPDIAQHFGRDHTTIIHAVKTIEGLCTRDKEMVNDIEKITLELKEGSSHGEFNF